jgi:hypothetical protein
VALNTTTPLFKRYKGIYALWLEEKNNDQIFELM